MQNTPDRPRTSEPRRRTVVLRMLPFAWLALSAVWAVVVVVTDQVAWPLAIWIATTVGPLTAIDRRHRGDGATDADRASI